MLLTKPSLVPPKVLAISPPIPAGARKADIDLWRRRFVEGKKDDKPAPPPRQNKIWNWTCTRGDKYAVAFAPDLATAQFLARRHAFVHLVELETAAGHPPPQNKTARERYYARIKMRVRTPQMQEISREEFDRLCQEQAAEAAK